MIFKNYYKVICALLPLFILCSILNGQTVDRRQQEKQKALENCKKRQFTSSRYDCDCLIAKYDETVEQMSKKNSTGEEISPELLKKYIPHLERNCERGYNVHIMKRTSGKFTSLKITPVKNPNLKGAMSAASRPACEMLELAKSGKGIKSMQINYGEPDYTAVMIILYKTTDCLPKSKLYDTYYKEAKNNLSSFVLGENLLKVSEEEYCECYANGMTKALQNGLTVGGARYKKLKKELIEQCRKSN